MLSFLFKHILSDDLTRSELRSMVKRSSFSKYLPWIAYDSPTKLYYLQDDTCGWVWECSPLVFAGQQTEDVLNGLFNIHFPEDSVMQFILHADDYIEPILQEYINLKVRQEALSMHAAQSFAKFIQDGTGGLKTMSDIPVRNFRLFVSLKFPKDKRKFEGINVLELRTAVDEILKTAYFNPTHLEPPSLLEWLRRFFNDGPFFENRHYDDTVPIRDQVIFGTDIERKPHFRIGNKHFRCLTPAFFPEEVDFFKSRQLVGGVWGIRSDMEQIKTPFLYAFNILFSNLNAKHRAKCEFILLQQAAGSLARSLADKKEEYTNAVHNIDRGGKYVQLIPILFVWGRDEQAALESVTRLKQVWGRRGFMMQEDKKMIVPLFIMSLPFGLYDDKETIKLIERDFPVDHGPLINTLPIQGGFAGAGRPIVNLVDRNGQLFCLDTFNRKLGNNFNSFIAGGTGGGKSFFVNLLVSNVYDAGGIVRIIDIGGSYKKQAKIKKGVFLDFAKNSENCLNPFSTINEIDEDLSAICAIFLQMIYSKSDNPPVEIAETVMTLIKDSILWAFKQFQKDAGSDEVFAYLNEYPNHSVEMKGRSGSSVDKIVEIAHFLAFNLREFTTQGRFGRWFNGKSTLDISRDEFVVLELENLKPIPELFKVVVLQIFNEIVNDAYLSDRVRERYTYCDEAWQFMGAQNVAMMLIIESALRRYRKYGGSMNIITQSVGDLESFGAIGDVIRTNTAYKFLLEAPNYDAMRAKKLIDYDDFTMELLKSVKRNGKKYSEIFVDTPSGKGVVRLAVDPYTYYLCTSDNAEFAEIESMAAQGLSYDEAIREMVRKYSN